MSSPTKKVNFYNTEIGVEILGELNKMAKDRHYNTKSTYSANTEVYPNNRIPFTDKHMRFLNTNPNISPYQYLSNLRLMTRIK